ncbi:MAG TPA: hypothetical protein VLF19_12215 [Methylomirabilota bacterium]|nr:hypothetical protein [Methylomirabilota bacterium]
MSRQREFLADADAVLLTRDPTGLALALVKVGAASSAANVSRAAAHLFLVEPLLPATGWWDRAGASHPPIEERVAVLGRMGSGIPPEAVDAAREAGVRFRTAPDERAAPAGASVVAHRPTPARREADDVTPGPSPAGALAGRDDGLPAAGTAGGSSVVSYLRLAQGPVQLLAQPHTAAGPCEALAAGTLLALLAVEGEFLRVQTTSGVTGYIGKDTAVTWSSD